MKKTKYILAIIIIYILSFFAYGLYKTLYKAPEPSPIYLIMQEESFKQSIKIQAENIYLDRQKAQIEKRKEELRKQELELASTTSLKE